MSGGWAPDVALDVVARLEGLLVELKAAARGSDFALVTQKVSTIETSLSLLSAYLREAAKDPS